MKGNLDEAEAQFRKAVETDPAHARSLFNLGLVLFERGKRRQHCPVEKGIETSPNYLEALSRPPGCWPRIRIRQSATAPMRSKFAERAARLHFKEGPGCAPDPGRGLCGGGSL
jgi:tetratricopeptide (TPR) repeat protein